MALGHNVSVACVVRPSWGTIVVTAARQANQRSVVFVPGYFSESLPRLNAANLVGAIAVLRLDGDMYASQQ